MTADMPKAIQQYKKYNPVLLDDKINHDRDSSVAYACLNYNQYLYQSCLHFCFQSRSTAIKVQFFVASARARVCVCVRARARACMCVCIYVCMFMCMYTYTHTHTHTHSCIKAVYVYIYTHTHI